LAVVLAASQIFLYEFAPPSVPFTCNALNWRNEAASDAPACPLRGPLGKIWVAGAGSVGMTLATRDFAVALIDHDRVKIHNLDRSPIFVAADIGQFKVDAAHSYLRGVGVREILADARPLHESRLWNERQPGEPDLLISAANEMKVRYYIEAGYPPRQLYGTTGQNWQAAVIRHEPFGKACSLCLFPADQASASTACATAPAETSTQQVEHVDAALPFLSFAAGLMTAAEAVKTRLPGYPFSQDRVILNTRPEISLISAPLAHRDGCFCETRNAQLYQTMLRAKVRANTP
jgi:molybdopterin/thiamine biosynthesis adenylyltransferase